VLVLGCISEKITPEGHAKVPISDPSIRTLQNS
jgi:hypothetical protein